MHGDRRVFFRTTLRKELYERIHARFGSDAEACKALRMTFEAAASRLGLLCDSEQPPRPAA